MSLDVLKRIIDDPIPYAHLLGYTKLTEGLHADWIRDIFYLRENGTLQAHRGAYKTTCLIIALTLRCIGRPTENTIFLRKSENDVKDVINAVSRNLQHDANMDLMREIFGVYPKLIIDSATELELSTFKGTMGRQILGLGLKASITGKHGAVVTDDIVTLKDRVSEAERKATKSQYMELINIASEEGQHIFNTGTPWHKDDAFSLMPPAKKYTVYETGILSKEEIDFRKASMTRSLFAANYELKHLSDEETLFPEPKYGEFPTGTKAWAHIDAAYGGEDSSSLTIMAEVDNKLHFVGWKYEGHIERYYTEICNKLTRYQVLGCALENNADKGFLKKELELRSSIRFSGYHESMNKYYKISTYGKSRWADVVYDDVNGDLEYISAIMDYNENAKYDDCPDSFASLVRWKFDSSSGLKIIRW